MGRYNISESDSEIVEPNKKGLIYSLISIIVMILMLTYMVIPGLPYSGILLNNNEMTYINKLFSPDAPIQEGLAFILSIILFIASIIYGVSNKTFKKSVDVVEL